MSFTRLERGMKVRNLEGMREFVGHKDRERLNSSVKDGIWTRRIKGVVVVVVRLGSGYGKINVCTGVCGDGTGRE